MILPRLELQFVGLAIQGLAVTRTGGFLARVQSGVRRVAATHFRPASYYFITTGGPLIRFPLKSTVTATRSAIVTKGIPLFIP